MSTQVEARETFDCFGSTCTVIVQSRSGDAGKAVADARRRLLAWHHRFSRFVAGSELSALNDDPRATVPVSPLMRRLLVAAVTAAELTGGLVDPTLAREIELAGYDRHFEGPGLGLEQAIARAPMSTSARPHPQARWRRIEIDRAAGTVSRPPGVRIDPGGIAKGVFADELAAHLHGTEAFAIDCAGDIRLGGASREVQVESPFDGSIIHRRVLSGAGVATSGIGRRSWLGPGGGPAHHLLDPATGAAAFTGVVQATAVAPTAARAEALSKAALLSGPEGAERWLPHGGVVVLEDGSHRVIDPVAAVPRVPRPQRLPGYAAVATRVASHATMSSST